MFETLRRRWEDHRINRLAVTREHWETVVRDWPPARRFDGAERDRLFDLSRRFLVRKEFIAGGGFDLNDGICTLIATMAVLPILNLGLSWYEGWYSVIVYEDTFVTPDGEMDEYGVVHHQGRALAGEAWLRGPVILSWADVRGSLHGDGYNVVLHELAHKLDMRSDGPNGAPPLHAGMNPARWHDVFSDAFQRLEAAERAGHPFLDPYALQDPGEFFAVVTESFFESPAHLHGVLPAVYEQLALFYRQDPLGGNALGD